ncbi:MAG: hypothetical protein QUU85_11915 [Candidatus Eisenbacteria bacterium]|nr:hypothetical protein [Candidatus Eisenbacteria bacterium]
MAECDGPGHDGDSGNAIALDDSSNVYVTGISNSSETGLNMDVVTIKYDSAGVPQWVRRYDSPVHGRDLGVDIAWDGAAGLYVTGIAEGSGGVLSDAITFRYSTDGQLEWTQEYDGPAHGHDASLALALDPRGGVAITGFTSTAAAGSDYLTIDYDAAGTPRWMGTYDGPVSGYDEGQAVTVGPDGKVYMTGYSDGGTGLVNYDFATIGYGTDGTELWTVRYQGPGDDRRDGGRRCLAARFAGSARLGRPQSIHRVHLHRLRSPGSPPGRGGSLRCDRPPGARRRRGHARRRRAPDRSAWVGPARGGLPVSCAGRE